MSILSKKEKKEADKFLAGFFLIITLYLLNNFSVKYSVWAMFPETIAIITLVALSYGPMLYFYVLSLIGKTPTKKQIAIHAIPILVVFLIILPFLFHSKEEKILYFTDKFINLPLNVSIGTFLQYLSAPIYFTWIILLLNKHKLYLKDNHSSIDKINLNWMRKLLYGCISIWLIDVLNVYALNFSSMELTSTLSLGIKFTFLVFVMLIGYYGINQGSIFSTVPFQANNEKEIFKEKKVKPISDSEAQKQTDVLLNYMQKEKAFLNSELRIQDLAVNLNMPIHVLSYVINTNLKQNFYDFVNLYRVEEVKQRLHSAEYNNFTIVAIAHDCGFNSKATFNRLFKKYTNSTPTQYKNLDSIE